MRTYTRNSPEAAARIVALTLLADGHLGQPEMEALQRIDVPGRLDISQPKFMGVVQGLCDDLMSSSGQNWSGTRSLSRTQVLHMLDEITDVGLRLILLQICAALSESDRHLAEGEYEMLCTLADHWDLPLPPLRTTSPKAMQTVGAAVVA